MMPPVRSRVYGFSLLLLCCASSGTAADRRVSCVLRYSALPDILPTNEKEPKPTGGSAQGCKAGAESALCGGAASRPGGSPRCGRTMQRSAGRVPSSTSMYCWPAACTDGRPSSAGRRLVQQWVGVEVRRVANGKAVSGERPRLGRRRYGAGSDVTAPRLWRRCR